MSIPRCKRPDQNRRELGRLPCAARRAACCKRGATTLAFGLALFSAGCTIELAVPTDARIECATDNDCPAGSTCNTVLSRCIVAAARDTTVPELGEVNVSPEVAGNGATVTVTLSPSKALALDPEVVLDTSDKRPFARLEGTAGEYTFTYVVKGDEPEKKLAVLVTLVDTSGNRSAALNAGTVTLDFTPPTLVIPDASLASTMGKGRDLRVSVLVNEALAGAPTAMLMPDEIALTLEESTFPGYTFGYTIGAGETEGAVSVQFEATDLAGNRGTARAEALTTLDFTAPSLAFVSVAPTLAKLGDLVVYQVSASELLSAVPLLTAKAGAVSLGVDHVSGSTYVFKHLVTTADTSGAYDVSAQLVDSAGNAALVAADATGWALPRITIDAGRPVIASLAADRARYSAVAPYDSLQISFDCSDDLTGGTLVAMVGTRAATCDSTGAPHFVCTYEADGSETEGETTIYVAVSDQAGNAAQDALTVTLDFSAPQISVNNVTPTLAKLGDVVSYSVVANELLHAAPSLVAKDASNHLLSLDTLSGTAYVFTHTVTSADHDGDYAVAIDLEDEVGNRPRDANGDPRSLTGLAISVDAHAPTLSIVAVSPATVSHVAGHDEVTVEIDTALESFEASPAQLRRSVGTDLDKTCTRGASTPYHYTCKYTTSGGETDGTVVMEVVARDPAGNSTTKSASFTYDSLPPSIVANSASLVVMPAADNLLRTVSGVKSGTTVQVSFSVSEPLASDPSVKAGNVTFIKSSSSGTRYVYTSTGVPEGDSDITVDVTDVAGNRTDPALVLPVAKVTGDTTPPLVSSIRQAAIVYTRVPWGSKDTSAAPGGTPVPTYTVKGGTSAVEGDVWVIIWDGPDITMANEVGRAKSASNGSFEVALSRTDRPRVYLSQVDAAGNIDDAVVATRLENIEWVASLGGKVAGSTFENPHQAWRQRSLADRLQQIGGVELGAGDGLGQVGGAFVSVSGAGSWRLLPALPGEPASATWFGLAYDSTRGVTYQFGGTFSDPRMWRWDGGTWAGLVATDPEGDGSPLSDLGMAMTYDSRRDRVVLYGAGATNDELWEWSGVSWEKRCDGVPATDLCALNPGSRQFFMMTYDSWRGQTVLFGGNGGDWSKVQATWEWDGSQWLQLATAGLRPTPRSFGALAFDTDEGKSMLFGGQDGECDDATGGYSDGGYCGALWSWDGSEWEMVCAGHDACSGPTPRSDLALAYDGVSRRLLLQGGVGAADPCDSDPGVSTNTQACSGTWAWNASTASWTRVCGAGLACSTGSTRRTANHMAFDVAKGVVVRIGPRYGESSNDTWEWTGGTWRIAASRDIYYYGRPPGDVSIATAYDAARGAVLAWTDENYGGQEHLIAYDGSDWKFVCGLWTDFPTCGLPERSGKAMAYHRLNGAAVLFGGCAGVNCTADEGQTYELVPDTFRRTCGDSLDFEPACGPSARIDHLMAYDENNHVVLMHGGVTFKDGTGGAGALLCDSAGSPWCDSTWAYDGCSWTYDAGPPKTWTTTGCTWRQVCGAGTGGAGCTGPTPARRGAAWAYDSDRQVTVLFGGVDSSGNLLGDSWEWDGAAWTERCPGGTCSPRPSARKGHTMAYDRDTKRLLLYSGQAAAATDELWQWDGTRWTQLVPADCEGDGSPAPRWGGALAYHEARKATLSVGSGVHGDGSREEWLFEAGAATRPGVSTGFSFAQAGASASASVEGVTATCYASGSGGGVDGASLRIWANGQWLEVKTNDLALASTLPGTLCDPSATTSPCLLRWSSDTSAPVGRYFVGTSRSLTLAVVPRGSNGTGSARVALDYCEAKVTYREP